MLDASFKAAAKTLPACETAQSVQRLGKTDPAFLHDSNGPRSGACRVPSLCSAAHPWLSRAAARSVFKGNVTGMGERLLLDSCTYSTRTLGTDRRPVLVS